MKLDKGTHNDLQFINYRRSFEDAKRGNQNPYIEEGQTTQWPKEK